MDRWSRWQAEYAAVERLKLRHPATPGETTRQLFHRFARELAVPAPSPDDYDESEPFEMQPVRNFFCGIPADAYDEIELWPDESESAK